MEDLRKLSEAGTGGILYAMPPDKDGVSVVAGRPDIPMYETPTNGQFAFVQIGFGAADTRDEAITNAALIAAAVNLTRRLLDPATVERMARIIDPSSWSVFDSYLATVRRKYSGQNGRYDPSAFKDKKSTAIAQTVLAVLIEGVEP